MNVFFVHAHHESKSFNRAMTRVAVETLESDGHEVVVSDLYAMKFDPISDRRNFVEAKEPDYLKQQVEERHASATGGFAPDVLSELEKLERCDALIFQFPLWWFGLPAILKGWVDRVFAMGRVYGNGKWFDRGVFAGKRAMLSLTTGGGATMFGERAPGVTASKEIGYSFIPGCSQPAFLLSPINGHYAVWLATPSLHGSIIQYTSPAYRRTRYVASPVKTIPRS